MENEAFMCFEVRNIQLNSFENKLLELIIKPENLKKKRQDKFAFFRDPSDSSFS